MAGTSIGNLRGLQPGFNSGGGGGGLPEPNEANRQPYIKQKEKEPDDFDIEELTRDINDNMIIDEAFSNDASEIDPNTSNKSHNIYDYIKEPLLLLIIYLILSQATVKLFAANYIPYLNPGPDGSVPFIGILIYGILLVTIYFLSKKLLL